MQYSHINKKITFPGQFFSVFVFVLVLLLLWCGVVGVDELSTLALTVKEEKKEEESMNKYIQTTVTCVRAKRENVGRAWMHAGKIRGK